MAFNIAEHQSVRLTQVSIGQRVTLCDYSKKRAFGTGVLAGWQIDGKPVPTPASMKDMDENIQMVFVGVHDLEGNPMNDVVLVRKPGTYGAMFQAQTSEATEDGSEAATVSYRRVTAYASVDDIARKAKEKEASKAKEEADATPVEETVTVEETA